MRTSAGVRVAIVSLLLLTGAEAQTPPSRMMSAANAFLSTLDQKQHQSVLFAFDDEKQRACWSNFPTSFVRRSGLSMGELSPRSVPPHWLSFRPRSAGEVSRRFSKLWRPTKLSRRANETTRYSGRIFTIFQSSERPPKKTLGSCSSEDTIWHSISRSPANGVFSHRL